MTRNYFLAPLQGMAYVKKSVKKKVMRKRGPAKNTKLVKLIKKVAAAQVHVAAEDKQQSLSYNLATFNNASAGAPDQLRILPFVTPGLSDAERIGDTINVRFLNLMGHIVVNPAFVTADTPRQRIMVRMVALQPKAYGTYTNAAANFAWMDTVLRNGNAVLGLDGSIRSMYLPWNYEAFNIFASKRIILRSDAFIGSATLASNYATAFFSMTFKFKNKKLKYTDTGSEPQGFCPILLFSYCFLDGSSASLASTAVSMAYQSLIKYEDA
uniref:Uncharacterized protein n=1 Tax=Diporeia sp. associated circular virus TaxID=1299317 RepID=M1T029_9VIRU|nr:hypothetical protein [Diporeia sp. associated circular virus]